MPESSQQLHAIDRLKEAIAYANTSNKASQDAAQEHLESTTPPTMEVM